MSAKNESSYSKTIFLEDFNAYLAAAKVKDFREANIFANRIMSNAYLFDSKNYGLMGFVLKEIANDGTLVQQSKDSQLLTEFSKQTSKYLEKLSALANKDSTNLNELWEVFSDSLLMNRDSFMTKNEKVAYKKTNVEFSNQSIIKLLQILKENKNLITYPYNNLFKGFLNEIGRYVKNHGLSIQDAHMVTLFMMISRIDEYVKGTTLLQEFPDRAKKEILPSLEKVLIVAEKTATTKNEDGIDDLLWELIKKWRLYFLQFMEIQRGIPLREEKVVEEPTQSKLVDAIAKEIEKEVGTE
ncbi:hypothetical protein [Candidatus Nitrosotenuis cloacae]|uniref:hypothetical protein n=1 Tax=Candidatus Nitrosotenuis cloacae TaxID=1603555 RepID=UPI0022813EFD|nr:hypothetical protein [Candidatus Nitrosotenuis cloacae]